MAVAMAPRLKQDEEPKQIDKEKQVICRILLIYFVC